MSPIVRLSGAAGGTGAFQVGSRTRAHARYRVEVTPERVTCGCPGYAYRHRCWHVAAVDAAVRAELRARAERRSELERSTERSRLALEEIADELGCD